MRYLVTGGAGFIGSHLSKRLVDEGHEVDIVDDLSNGERAFLPRGHRHFFACDFSDDLVLDKVRNSEYDVVFHLAAMPRVSYSVEYPSETTDVNVMKVVRLMDACRGNIKRFVNTSSSSVYGGADKLPTKETAPHDPKSPYALQKSVIEQYCRLFSSLYNLDTVSVRPFNVFGPNQKGNGPYSTAVSAWFYGVKHGTPLRSDGDGTQSRDVTYVDNVVDIFCRCANYEGKFAGDAFNAGTGIIITNNEILDWFRKKFPNAIINNAPWRPGDVMHTQASIAKAKKVLGYKPLVTFWKGLEMTKKWALKNPIF
jgi:nucleoside-diphosphate-sugar epimerase